VKQEWERSQEQYNHLRQTVGVLQGSAVSSLIKDDDDDDDDDDLEENEAHSRDVLRSLMGSAHFGGDNFASRNDDVSLGDNDTVMTEHTKDSLQLHRVKQQQGRKLGTRNDDASLGDNDTVITEHTKDSLQLHRVKQQQRRKPNGAGDGAGDGGLSKFFSKQQERASQPPPTSSSGTASKLGSFLESDGKKPSKPIEKDLKSASE
jgi:hypothetical protein